MEMGLLGFFGANLSHNQWLNIFIYPKIPKSVQDNKGHNVMTIFYIDPYYKIKYGVYYFRWWIIMWNDWILSYIYPFSSHRRAFFWATSTGKIPRQFCTEWYSNIRTANLIINGRIYSYL